MQDYSLIDITHNSYQKKYERMYLVSAQLAIKYGTFGESRKKLHESFCENRIREFWKYDDKMPSPEMFRKHVKVQNVKWYINKYIQYKDDIWNSDYLHGLSKNGKLKYTKKNFPMLVWSNTCDLMDILKISPFGGKFTVAHYHASPFSRWTSVPAFYMQYSFDSYSFIAGVLSPGRIVQKDDETLIMYPLRIMNILKKIGIPIEKSREYNKKIFISPIWPALFSFKMPETIRNKWFNLENPAKVDIYAPILWRTYINNDFVANGIPYLKCRRKIYYDYKCEEGAMRKLEKLRVETGLVDLDKKVGEVVKIWASENKGKTNEISTN